jgi:hypothetical protein
LTAPARKSKANASRTRNGRSRESGGHRGKILAWTVGGLLVATGGIYLFYVSPLLNVKKTAQTTISRPSEAIAALPLPPMRQLHIENPGDAPKPSKPTRKELAAVTPGEPAIDRWFMEAYLRCWSPPTNLPDGDYAAKVRVTHDSNGGLAGAPVLVNPPSDPDWRPYADSAVQAVKKCNPLHVPSDFAPRFEAWKKVTLYFAPDSARQ